MANEPMPWQLKVGQLRAALSGVSDDVVVVLGVPPGGVGHPTLAIGVNLEIRPYSGGPIFAFRIYRPDPEPQRQGFDPEVP